MDIDKIINIIREQRILKEEMSMGPTNNVGDGKIAGTVQAGDDPPVRKRKKKGEPTIIGRGCFPGARKRWTT